MHQLPLPGLPDIEQVISIQTENANFGLVIVNGRVTEAPPIARWAVGKDYAIVRAYYLRRDAQIHEHEATPPGRSRQAASVTPEP